MSVPLETLPTASVLSYHTSRANMRIPPIACQSISLLPCRIAAISRDKLSKEVAGANPDLRRCVAHQSLLRRSMEEAQESIRSRMASLHLEDDDDDPDVDADVLSRYSSTSASTIKSTSTKSTKSTENPSSIIRHSVTAAVRAMAQRCHISAHPHSHHGSADASANSYEAALSDFQKSNHTGKIRKHTRLVPNLKSWSPAKQTMKAQMVG